MSARKIFAALFLIAIVSVSFSYQGPLFGDPGDAFEQSAPATNETPSFGEDRDVQGPIVGNEQVQTKDLLQRFLKLTEKKAGRMSKQELEKSIRETERLLVEEDKKADAALKEAVFALSQVVINHSGTESAMKAEKALGFMGLDMSEIRKLHRERSVFATPFSSN